MATYHVTLDASVPDQILTRVKAGSEGRPRLLLQCWQDRREIDWQSAAMRVESYGQSLTKHNVRLTLDPADGEPGRAPRLRFDLDVVTRGDEHPCDKARRLLDLPGAPSRCGRIAAASGVFERRSFATVRGDSLIGPVPGDWPIGRLISGYSHNLGSYGQGGVGLSGWQLNRGSWLVFPLMHSEGFIWLTQEILNPAADFLSIEAIIDHRIIGVHPNQIEDFPPWDHLYTGRPAIRDLPNFATLCPTIVRFETTPSGFVLEAANGLDLWRFAMDDHLPRPFWGGAREPRDLYAGESVADSFVLTHDCYLDV